MKGVFISFEGIEGTGKSTQVRLLADHLRKKGISVTETAEPGGTSISIKIRELLLSLDSRGMDPVTELLLYNAARVQHIRDIITPALERGEIVVTDRFSDSTVAYQGYGRGIDLTLIASLDQLATNKLSPHLTILLDLDVETGLRRNKEANKNDRIEQEEIAFHARVRQGFINIAATQTKRIRLVNASTTKEEIHRNVVEVVETFLAALTP